MENLLSEQLTAVPKDRTVYFGMNGNPDLKPFSASDLDEFALDRQGNVYFRGRRLAFAEGA